MFKNEKSRIVSVKKTIVLLSLILMYGQILFATSINLADDKPKEGINSANTNNAVLVSSEKSDKPVANIPARPEHYKVIDGNPCDPVWTIYFEQGALSIGDEIVVYDGEILVGAGIVISDNILDNVIPIFSNLYKSGNYPIFRVWSKNEKEELFLTDFSYINPYGDAYIEEVFPQTDGEYSMLNFSVTGISNDNYNHPSLSIYPNPSEGIFNISIERVNVNLFCEVMDLRGNDYCNFEFSGIKGSTTKQLDLKELPAGVYFIIFSGKDFYKVKKIIIQ